MDKIIGELVERFIAPVLKTGDPKDPRVRIPDSPQNWKEKQRNWIRDMS